MGIDQFAKKINHNLCKETFDMFYLSLKNEYPIYLSRETINWFGYGGDKDDQKRRILDILKKHYIKDVDWFEYSHKAYTELYNEMNPIHSEQQIDGTYISDKLLSWMGYDGEPKAQMLSCKKILERNFDIDSDYMIYKNKEYINYLDTEFKGSQMATLNKDIPPSHAHQLVRRHEVKHMLL